MYIIYKWFTSSSSCVDTFTVERTLIIHHFSRLMVNSGIHTSLKRYNRCLHEYINLKALSAAEFLIMFHSRWNEFKCPSSDRRVDRFFVMTVQRDPHIHNSS